MEAVSREADASLDSRKRINGYQNNLKNTAQLLADCVAAIESSFREQSLPNEAKVALLDLENAIDSTLLNVNSDFATSVEALWKVSSSGRAAQLAEHECQAREIAASEAGNDLETIMKIYETPLAAPADTDEANVNPGSLESSVKLDQYKDFCRIVFGVRDAGAKAPTNKEAMSIIQMALKERQLLAQEEEDGLEVGESVIKPVCLISSKLLEEPVKASCGHYFSQAYIIEVIRRNGGEMTCPSRGCHNLISEKQLVRDRMMDLRVLQYLRREDRAKQLESETVGRVS